MNVSNLNINCYCFLLLFLSMIMAINKTEICEGLQRQLQSFFAVTPEELQIINAMVDEVLERCKFCFAATPNKYYAKDGEVYFNPFHSGQYTIFLYYLSNSIFKLNSAHSLLADKIYYLNKIMNGCDLFYEITLPAIFMLDHPVGTVMGRAQYGNYFTFGQNCTVGNNKGVFPVIGESVKMSAASMILGNSKIGNHVILGAGACVKDQVIPDYSLVFGSSPQLLIKPNLIQPPN